MEAHLSRRLLQTYQSRVKKAGLAKCWATKRYQVTHGDRTLESWKDALSKTRTRMHERNLGGCLHCQKYRLITVFANYASVKLGVGEYVGGIVCLKQGFQQWYVATCLITQKAF